MCDRIYDYVSDVPLQSKILIGNTEHIAQFSAYQNVRFSDAALATYMNESRASTWMCVCVCVCVC